MRSTTSSLLRYRITPKVSITMMLIFLSSIFLANKYAWKVNGEKNMYLIGGDGKGYYYYLPFFTIDKNIQYSANSPSFIIETEGGRVNKYTVGTAICIAPFYSIAYFYQKVNHQTIAPYSYLYQIVISLSSIIYLMLGLWFLSLFLAQLGFNSQLISITVFAIYFATNLLSTVLFHPAFSHTYSFAINTLFLLLVNTFLRKKHSKYLVFAGLALGLTILIRPFNVLVIFLIPFLLSSNSCKVRLTFVHFIQFLSACFGVVLIQLIIWKLQTGNFLVWGYANEGFNFDQAEIFKVLFSFRKGLFIYTPLTFIALTGLWVLFRRNFKQFLSLFLFLIILLYLISAWWNWYYGPSFGMRPFIDYYAVFAFLFATLLKNLNTLLKKGLISLLLILTFLNLLQHYQYSKGIISKSDMTYEKYKKTFGVLKAEESIIGGSYDIIPYNSELLLLYEKSLDFEKNNSDVAYDSISQSRVLDYSNKEYLFDIKYKPSTEALNSKGLYVEIEFKRLEKKLNSSKKAQIIMQLRDSSLVDYHYYWFYLNEAESDHLGWKKYKYTALLSKPQSLDDELMVIIRNQEKGDFYVDDIKVKVYAIKNKQ